MNSLWLAAILLAAPACAAPAKRGKTEEKKPVSEWKGQFGGNFEHKLWIVDREENWARLWKHLGKPAPAVDFSKNVAIFLSMGPRNTGGYTAVWDGPKEDDKKMHVRVAILPPKGMAMQALTEPWAIKLFPWKGKPYDATQVRPEDLE